MNINPLTIYLWQIADSIDTSFLLVSLVSFAACAVLMLMFIYNQHCAGGGWQAEKNKYPTLNAHMDVDAMNKSSLEENTSIKPWLVRAVVLFSISFTASTLLPSSKTIAMMVVIPKIADSKVIQKDLPDIYNTAIEALKQSIKPTAEKP